MKDIHSICLERHYSPLSLKGVENIGINKFVVKKVHLYKIIVIALYTGRILYVGAGNRVDAPLASFGKDVDDIRYR
ncbi:MAG: hypothetical protein ACI4A7_01980 [Prevotella sp.]